jgi:hypothetical protein
VLWATLTCSMVVAGVGVLVLTIGRIQNTTREEDYFRLSIRFWAMLAVLGVLLVIAFSRPMLELQWMPRNAGLVTAALVSVPIAVVIAGGLRNAMALWLARRRRQRAFTCGELLEATVVSRARRPLTHDILAITVEADVPETVERSDLAYRTRTPDGMRKHRFVETCPGDQWARFEPGARVRLRVDPQDLDTYAVVLF